MYVHPHPHSSIRTFVLPRWRILSSLACNPAWRNQAASLQHFALKRSRASAPESPGAGFYNNLSYSAPSGLPFRTWPSFFLYQSKVQTYANARGSRRGCRRRHALKTTSPHRSRGNNGTIPAHQPTMTIS